MMSRFFPKSAECGHHLLFGSVSARTYAGETVQLSLVDIPAGGVVEWHSHSNEQIGMVIFGQAVFYIGEEQQTLGPGDMYYMPSHTMHKVVALQDAVQALDVFTPVRDEYR